MILNAGLIVVPDEIVTEEKYLENIDGITYMLEYNNVVMSPPRLPYSYICFYRDWLDDEEPTFQDIRDDLTAHEGPTFDYLQEHPPNDRILPVLEKAADILAFPILKSKKEKHLREKYKQEIIHFFKTQCPDWFKSGSDKEIADYHKKPNKIPHKLEKTCIMFKQNTNNVNFNVFELFTIMLDIYDRILHSPQRYTKLKMEKPSDVTAIDNIKDREATLKKKHHFAASLSQEDWGAMNDALLNFKQGPLSFFPRLQPAKLIKQKIKDNCFEYQKLSLSFLLFIKAFMHYPHEDITDREYEFDGEGYKLLNIAANNHWIPPGKTKKRPKGVKQVKAEIKYDKLLNKHKKGEIRDITDIFITFHNENFPLQIDLVILPKNKTADYDDYKLTTTDTDDYFLYSEEIRYHSKERRAAKKAQRGKRYQTYYKDETQPIDRIHKLYRIMVDAFHKMLREKKNLVRTRQKKIRRRDDRYVMVIDRSHKSEKDEMVDGKLYIYPPHILNGDENDLIVHRKNLIQIAVKKDKEEEETTDTTTDKNEGDNKENKTDDDENKNIQEVRNTFSYIAHDYNDITNFYLTHKCLIPSKKDKNKMYGANDLPFVLSVHFHKQRQWHRHPKMRIYQYFYGGGMRFMHKPTQYIPIGQDEEKKNNDDLNTQSPQISYKWDQDMINIWPDYFVDSSNQNQMNEAFIRDACLFDGVFDLYKCDMPWFQWDNAVKRHLKKLEKEQQF